MGVAIILATDDERDQIASLQQKLDGMTDRQRAFADHLLRSWGVTSARDPIGMMRDAVDRAKSDR